MGSQTSKIWLPVLDISLFHKDYTGLIKIPIFGGK